MAVLVKTKTPSWADGLAQASQDGQWPMPLVSLDDEQVDLLDEHAGVISFLRTDGARKMLVTLAVCDQCGMFWMISSGAAPTSCNLTKGCTGKPVKVSAAKTR
jgi:hypothetical protein